MRSKHMYFDATWVLFEVSGVHITKTQWDQSLDEFALKDEKIKLVIFFLNWVDLETNLTKQPFSNGVLWKIAGKYFCQNSWLLHLFFCCITWKSFYYISQTHVKTTIYILIFLITLFLYFFQKTVKRNPEMFTYLI